MIRKHSAHHIPKVRTAHTRLNFGKLFKKPQKHYLNALAHAEFYDFHSKRVKWSFFKKYHTQLIDTVVFLLTFAFSFILMFWSFQYKDGQMIMVGRVWSDFAAHIPLIRSFSMGHNFPPEYPTFPGEPIRYHYLFFVMVAAVESLGFNIAFSFNLISALGMWLLLWMIYHTTLTLFKSRKAAMLAIVLFLLNGTWSIWEIIKVSHSALELVKNIVNAPEYASFGPWDGKIVSAFWNWNIYLNQRHLAASFGLALAVSYPLLRLGLDKTFKLKSHWYPLIYFTFILFPIFHQAAYVMSIGWCLLWCVFYCRKIPKKVLYLYFWSFLFSLITHFGLSANSKQHNEFAVTYEMGAFALKTGPLGYLAKDKTAFGIAYYWLFNLGFYSILLPIIFLFSPKKVKAFFLPFIGFFVLANIAQLSTDMINNHKLVNYFTIGGNIITAGFLMMLWRKHWIITPVILIVILGLTASGIADIFPLINNHFLYVADYPQSPVAMWVKDNTLPKSIFLSNDYIFNPASIVGRKLFLDYGYFNWSMGYPDGERRQLLKIIYNADLKKSVVCDTLVQNHIDYVHLINVHSTQEYDVEHSTLFKTFQPIYKNDSDQYIFKVSDNCEH